MGAARRGLLFAALTVSLGAILVLPAVTLGAVDGTLSASGPMPESAAAQSTASTGIGVSAASTVHSTAEIPPPTPFRVVSPADGAVVDGPVTTIAGIGGGPSTPVLVFVDHRLWCTTGWPQDGAWSCSGTAISAAGVHSIDVVRLAYGDWFGSSSFTISTPPPPPPTPAAPAVTSIDGATGGMISVGSSTVASGYAVSGDAVYDPNYPAQVTVTISGGESCTSPVASDGRFSCLVPGALAVGDHALTAEETIQEVSDQASVTLRVTDDTPPAAPKPPAVVSVRGANAGVESIGTSKVALGLAVAGTAVFDANYPATVTVVLSRTSGSTTTTCSSAVASDGTFSCTLPAPAVGTYTLRVRETIAEVDAEQSISLTVFDDIPASPPVSPPAAPTGLHKFGAWVLSVTNGFGVGLNTGVITPGGSIIVTGRGLASSATITIELHSTPVVLASLRADGSGGFSQTATIPASTETGAHLIVVRVSAPGYADDERDMPLTVSSVAAAAAPPASQSPAPSATPVPRPSAAEKPQAGSAAPQKTYNAVNTAKLDGNIRTILSQLTTAGEVKLGPVQLAAAGGLVVGLIFLVALPALLLEATLRENYDRIFRFAEPVRKAIAPLGARITSHRTGFWAWVGLYTLIVAFILSFADPDVAPDLKSLRLILALVLAQVVHDLVLVLISGRLATSALRMQVRPVLRPGGIVFVVLGVIITRVFGLEPGVLIGAWLVLMASASSVGSRGKLALTRTGVMLCVGLVAWLGYSLLTGGAETFWSLLGTESLSAVMVGAISELLIAMLPMRFLEGREIWEWSKGWWFAGYALVAALFAIVVLPQPVAWMEMTGPAIAIGAVFGAFGLLCVGVWAAFRFTASKVELEEIEERQPLG